jgi:tetratricopeptide (TPR) repeat protein
LANWGVKGADDFANRAMAYLQSEQFDKALDDFNQAILLDQSHAPLRLWWRGMTHYKLGNDAEAITDFQRAIEANPNYWQPLAGLAWLLAAAPDDRLRNGEKSVKLATKACELTQFEHAGTVATLAAAQAAAGEFGIAIDLSKEAIELDDEGSAQAKLFERRLKNYREGRPWRITDTERRQAQFLGMHF